MQLPLLYKAYLWYDDEAQKRHSAQEHGGLLEMLRTAGWRGGGAALAPAPPARTRRAGRAALAEAEAGEAYGENRYEGRSLPRVRAGASVLRYEDVEDPVAGEGELVIEMRACGVNHFDIDLRAGISR